jgi:hypothetical protein
METNPQGLHGGYADRLIHNAISKRMFTGAALLASVGSLAISEPGDADMTNQAGPNNTPIGAEVETEINKQKCTYIRLEGLYINISGRTCAEDGAKSAPVPHERRSHGWILSVVYIDGVTKCGYIKPHVLPTRRPRSGEIRSCRKYKHPLKNQSYIDERNCGDINGVDACKSGTYQSPVTESCSTNGIVYTQYATRGKSPWNMHGVQTEAFSRPLSAAKNDTLSYRAIINVGEKQKAAVVRSQVGWGVTSSNCIPRKHRFGGTCKDRNRDTDEHGLTVCGRSKVVREDAHRWRKLLNQP